jgi:elongation factor 1 alpha-like protein
MSNKRVKSLAVDDDDFEDDDYYEDEYDDEPEEMTAEDQRQLDHGVIMVRNGLGPQYNKIPEKEIRDALWNFYYDDDKAVTYFIGAPSLFAVCSEY